MSALYLVNPRAGRGRGERLAAELPDRLRARGLDGEVRVTAAPREATALARAAAADPGLIVAVGGDGTAHEVVNGVAGTEATFGLIPFGSGNDLALALGIPPDVDAALDIIAAGNDRRIDLARYDDAWFGNSLGLGFEAQVTIESARITWLRGFAIYLWGVIKALRHLRCPELTITADDEVRTGRRLLVCVGNGPRVGGGFYLTPQARNDDGILDLCLVEELGRLDVVRLLPKSLDGTHTGDPAAEMLQARRIRIESPDGFPFHVDGEVVDAARHRLDIELVPRALKVRAPGP